ncbi:hypothetical protein K435DRAFT_867791 [Dendrothele bispora CBS 962.96]|uniref:Uncharacterized protein n=1 Tax=Dendrothele bispora (strain CBS 962.96) TaxID=1314807 RepID=A0A4S8LDC1_DENBC|nr:hypothetical protein K435DRAFT_867791 [Dendrothele bispora CBS 962.96]
MHAFQAGRDMPLVRRRSGGCLESDGGGEERVLRCETEECMSKEGVVSVGAGADYLWPLLRCNGRDMNRGGTAMMMVKKKDSPFALPFSFTYLDMQEHLNLDVNTPIERLLLGTCSNAFTHRVWDSVPTDLPEDVA